MVVLCLLTLEKHQPMLMEPKRGSRRSIMSFGSEKIQTVVIYLHQSHPSLMEANHDVVFEMYLSGLSSFHVRQMDP